MVKVKLLEAIAPHEKNDEIEMREDLAKGIFKDKVEILKGQKKEKKEDVPVGKTSEECRKILDEAGITYHPKLWEAKLNTLVSELEEITKLREKATELKVDFTEETTKEDLQKAIDDKEKGDDVE